MRLLRVWVVSFLGLVLGALGQVCSEVMVIPLGDLPAAPLNKGMGPLAKSDLPPVVSVLGQGGKVEEIALDLNQFSKPVAIPVGEGEAEFRRGKNLAGLLWQKVKRPPEGEWLMVMIEDPGGQKLTWDRVNVFLLDRSAKGCPAGHVRVFNASGRKVAYRLGGNQAFGVSPGKTKVSELMGANIQLGVAFKNPGGKYQHMFQNQIQEPAAGQRVNVFVYEGRDGRMKMKILRDVVPK